MYLLTISLCNLFMMGTLWLSYHAFTAEVLMCVITLIILGILSVKHIRGRLGGLLTSAAFFLFWTSGIVSLAFYNDFFAVGITEFRPERTGLLSQYVDDLPFTGLAVITVLAFIQYHLLRMPGPKAKWNRKRATLATFILLASAGVSQLPSVMTFAQDHSVRQTSPGSMNTLYEASDFIVPDSGIDGPVDIYVIQSESFFDIRRLGINLTSDPYVTFDALKSESLWGELGVPVQGGITSNSEFEFLTGVRASEISNVPFDDFIEEPIPSLASKAKQAGFSTTGIHPNTADFYRRNIVYPLLGFDRFLSIDDFVSPEKMGAWVRDSVGFERVLKETTTNSNVNNLIFYVTVQNHGPYLIKWENPIYPDGLSRDDTWSIRNLAGGHRESDRALNGFIDRLRKSDKRSIVVLYGDHQPAASHDFYNTLPYFNTKSNAFRTEYLIWDSAQLLKKGNADTNILSLGAAVRSLIPGNVSLNDRFLTSQYKDASLYLNKTDDDMEAAVSAVAASVRRKDATAMETYLK